MKIFLLIFASLFAAHDASAACSDKRTRDPSFVELAVPDDAIRPAGVADFSFVTGETTVACPKTLTDAPPINTARCVSASSSSCGRPLY